uniref:Polyprotein n=1 Tax=Steinernema glaseri TaxID=37863 RepID=A0A1I7Y7U0_9BILA
SASVTRLLAPRSTRCKVGRVMYSQLNFGQQPLDDPGYGQPAFPQPVYPSRPAARPQEPLFPQELLRP